MSGCRAGLHAFSRRPGCCLLDVPEAAEHVRRGLRRELEGFQAGGLYQSAQRDGRPPGAVEAQPARPTPGTVD
ncbi:MAG: hypothetical protein ACYCUM_09055 [Solirubrobacteraceae bacterium]